MKIEDKGVIAEYVPGRYLDDPDTVRFTSGDSVVDVPIDMLNLAWRAWA